jgi:cation diffusion facilitator CzcD-associated flavoprotein CzcO
MDLPSTAGLDALTQRARIDLERIAHPRQAWLDPRPAPNGAPALDVLIIGAGQSGLATAFGLQRARVDNVLVVDRAPAGQEGPWRTYARMPTLRSPKDFTGPDLDVPALTYQSWHEARYGIEHWQALRLIARQDWADYLDWLRSTVRLPVRNGLAASAIRPVAGLLAVDLTDDAGRVSTAYARKIVLATGQDGFGRWWMPDSIAALPADRRSHTADAIDFPALAGRRVAVLGAGASAFDNAAMALEAGAAQVRLFCRRATPQVVQPYRWLTFRGLLAHMGDLDDAWRWRFMSHILGLREGFPQETYDRCRQHADRFEIIAGAPIERATVTASGIGIETPRGRFEADHLICGTGIDMDFAARPELVHAAAHIATWADRYTPPTAERDDRLARFPYLDRDYALTERTPGTAPWLADLHVFSIAATMSFGPSGSSINAMTTAVPRLVAGLTRGLFTADLQRHWAALQAYDVPQAVLR